MRKQFEVTIPEGWKDITLKQYLELQKDLETYKDDEDAIKDVLLYRLCGIEPSDIKTLSMQSRITLDNEIQNLFNKSEEQGLQPIVKIGDTEYGFEPNLSQMSYGSYVDISKFDNLAIDSNWAHIMSILYRPIVKKQFDSYLVEPYEGYINENIWLNQTMDIHFGAYFFFVHLLRDLVNSTLNSLMQTSEIPPNIKSILQKSGKLIQQSLNLQEEISKK
jgi:hypothetical protein